MIQAPPFILASASPRRLQLLKQAGLAPVQVLPADIDETPLKAETPTEYAARIAAAKAEKIASLHPDLLVLSADTVVALGRRILPKAEDEQTATHCLQLLKGRRHRVHTAVTAQRGQRVRHALVTTTVKMKRLTGKEIAAYVATGEWHGKAGGYGIQGLAETFIPFLSGSYSNVVGLPLTETIQLLTYFDTRSADRPALSAAPCEAQQRRSGSNPT
ncbi:MAG: Maf family protein [Rickettsiales bacterium]|nr:Maf family protein [Rickettsiales bacterium]